MEEKKASRSGNKYYEVILDWFRQQILSGQMKEGDPIPSERELASQFGVSRVPVREALRILEYIGIINNGPDGMTIQRVDVQLFTPGANFATEITQETIENLFEVRIFLESAAAYYAALRHTDEDIVLTRSSHAFHLRVITAAKNPVLENLYRSLYDLLEISKQYTMRPESVSDSTLMDHEAILYKIESGNAEDASKYMKFHLSRALKRVMAEHEKMKE